jgi:hypothetical protein
MSSDPPPDLPKTLTVQVSRLLLRFGWLPETAIGFAGQEEEIALVEEIARSCRLPGQGQSCSRLCIVKRTRREKQRQSEVDHGFEK